MENDKIKSIKHTLKELLFLAENSKGMSDGARLLIIQRVRKINIELETIELELMAK